MTAGPTTPHHPHDPHHRHGRRSRRHKLFRSLVSFSRLIHIYLTMLGLFLMLLFGITGYTINHEDWFGATAPKVDETTGTTPAALITANDQLRIVENLRQAHGVTGALTSFDDFEDEYSAGFKSPGQIWEVRIAKKTGATAIHHESFNLAAIVNNLHRGRYTGPAWRWIIDLTALLICLACATGFILWLALPHRRKLGVALLVLGTAATLAIALFLIPGPDKPLPPPTVQR